MKSIYIIVIAVISFFSFALNIDSLTSITINDDMLIPYFNQETKVYNYYTNKDIITIKITKEENEEVKGYGTFNLKDGLNEFEIISTKENIKTKYIINVFKNYKKQNNDSSLLKNLEVENYEINFDSLIFKYEININDEENLNIKYEPASENAVVKIIGNSNLNKENNLIKIIVNNKQSESIYELKINKTIPAIKITNEKEKIKELSKSEKIIFITIIVLTCITLASTVYYLLFIRKKKHK